jgi:haloalkane dehalogenase
VTRRRSCSSTATRNLYRHLIPGLVARVHRVVAPDLMGMGRSDKPADPDTFTLARHVDWLSQWLVGEDLRRITLFCQDWGGTAGLNLLPLHGERFERVIASNTGLPTGQGMNKFMEDWLAFSQSGDELPISVLVNAVTTRELTPDERLAYEAPFPDGSYPSASHSSSRCSRTIPVCPRPRPPGPVSRPGRSRS